jgi:hypothetical protein
MHPIASGWWCHRMKSCLVFEFYSHLARGAVMPSGMKQENISSAGLGFRVGKFAYYCTCRLLPIRNKFMIEVYWYPLVPLVPEDKSPHLWT